MNEASTRDTAENRQRHWLEAFWAGQTQVLELILAGLPLTNVLDRIARRISEMSGPGTICSIYLANPEGTLLTLAAAPGLPQDLLHAGRHVPIAPQVGSCGTAAATGKPVVIADITTHCDWEKARELVLLHGLKACWSVPVFSSEGKVLGTLGIYHRQHRLPGHEDMTRAEAETRLISLAIERCRAIEKQRNDEALLRIAGRNARLGGWTVDLPELKITWSDDVRAIHEMPPGYAPTIHEAFEFYAPEYRQHIYELFQRCVEEGVAFDDELQLITGTGRRVWVRAMGEAVRADDGTVIRIQGAFQDNTAKINAEQSAHRLSERLTNTLDKITDAFFTVDREWRFIYLNREAEKVLRTEKSQMIGKVLWEEFPGIIQTELREAYEGAMSRQQTTVLEEFYYPPHNEWYEIRAYPTDEGIAVYFRSITARRQSREQLRLLEACVSRINDIVIITEATPIDEPGPRIVFVNDAFTRCTGYTREEAIGKSPRMLQGPKTQSSELDRMRIALKKGQPVRTQVINYRKDGGEIWLEIDFVPVAEATGKAAYVVAVQRDITERKLAEDGNRAGEERYVRQRNSLIALTGIQPLESDDEESAFRRITEAHARALGVARVSIWRYNHDRTAIRCADLYEMEAHRHSSGMELPASSFPAYFRAMEEMDVISAEDAASDSRTREFTESYLKVHGITSMLDAPVHRDGVVEGVLCSEHVGPPRKWTGDEKTFTAAVANLVSLALEGCERRKAENAVREIQQRFEIVARATNDAVWDWDLDNDEIWWSEGFEKLFGHSRSQLEPSSVSWSSRIHPEDVDRVLGEIHKKFEGIDDNWSGEYRFLRADGTYAYVLDRGFVIRDGAGRALRMVGGMSDITSRKHSELTLARLNRALKMLSACNEAVTRAIGEEELLTKICQVAVKTGGYRMAWVGYAEDNPEKLIRPMAFAGIEEGYLSTIQLSWDENKPTGQGPGGRTIRSGEAVVCLNVEAENAFFHYLGEARERGYRSVICLPLRDGERVFGLLGLYGSEVRSVGEDEIKLLQELADDLAFGIGTIRARLERQRTEDIVLKVAQSVSSGTGSEFFDLLTLNMVEALGAHGGLIGRLNAETLEITTLSFVLEGKLMDNVTYGLYGTPCENVSEGNVCVFDRGVQELFPEDHLLVFYGIHAYAGIPLFNRDRSVAGIMVVFFSAPLEERGLVQSTLQIFAARAAAELDRQLSDIRIREQASLLDRARDAILVSDLDHHITYWNKSAERLYGWTAEEASGRAANELLHPDPEAFRMATAAVVRDGEWTGELTQQDRNGRQLVIEGRWTLLRDPADQPRNILCIHTDITEHKKLEEQFLRAQRLESIGTLAGGIAHDLNNVLSPISMSIELLQSDVTSERGRELLATLASSAKRGAEMVNQVLSFARGMDGRRLEICPRSLVGDVEKIIRDTFPKNISLRSHLPRSLWTLTGDPTQLHQVLLNLCVNARDAMPEGGDIVITAENVDLDERFATSEPDAKPGPHVLIRVEDTGHGIPAKLLDKIFEPFFTTKEVGKGTGLGLSTSLAIVKSHGGFIRAASAPGRGSCFLILLPARPSPVEAAPGEEDRCIPHGEGEMILVADDEPSIRQITRKILEAYGYRVLLASDGMEAVEIYRQHCGEIAAVITDMMMPEMDGSQTIRMLAMIDPEVRIIAASGISDKGRMAKEENPCVRYFVPKPYTSESLLRALEIALSRNS
ncbi:PAS domain S-box protein [Luteolibacter luteus]|uniref:histidine kinase n=1 Tax=Luteolibacter luteus TaxID=2728835 RepID=A0A858RL43_9BACT|nr:PAS domain S-box protein [Luteolibacter luteus]QJE97214.1 PAS domain S-box protein [Luteolibacter luteus]